MDTHDVSDVLFGIKERQLVYFENGGPPVETDYKVILNAETNECLYSGKIYSPILNADIMDSVSEYDSLQLARVRSYYGKRFEFTFIMPELEFNLGPEKTIFSMNIMNSYDGTTSLHVVGGLYVLVCTNGAKIGKMTYQFSRKHTSSIGRHELSGFIRDSVDYISSRSLAVMSKPWSNDVSLVKNQFKQLSAIFPARKDDHLHPGVMALDAEYGKMSQHYNGDREFALFMAATGMATRPKEFGLGISYTKSLDSIVGEVFFN